MCLFYYLLFFLFLVHVVFSPCVLSYFLLSHMLCLENYLCNYFETQVIIFPQRGFTHTCYGCIGALAIQAYLNLISITNTIQSWNLKAQSSLLLLRCSLLRSQPKGVVVSQPLSQILNCNFCSLSHMRLLKVLVSLSTISSRFHKDPKCLRIFLDFFLLQDLGPVVYSLSLCLFDALKKYFNIFVQLFYLFSAGGLVQITQSTIIDTESCQTF